MRLVQRFWLSGPLVVRDFVVGAGGVSVALMAFIAGCAFASAGSLLWFAFWASLAAASLYSSVLQLRRVGPLLTSRCDTDDSEPGLPLAA
jgi:hypothetical protein